MAGTRGTGAALRPQPPAWVLVVSQESQQSGDFKPVPPRRSFEECLEAAWHFLFKLQSLAPFSRRQKQTPKSKCAPGPTIYLWENWALIQMTSYLTLTSSPLGLGWKNTACMLLILSMQPKSLK